MTDAKRILIAEDNPALAAVVRFNLQSAGFETTVAKNGKLALEQTKNTNFDLVITDQQMPLMTGVELCESLRQNDSYTETPIILLTAKAFELDPASLNELQISQLIRKPFSPSEIVEIVEQHFAATSV